MRLAFAGILTATVGALGALAAASASTYSTFHQQLIGLAAANNGIVPLDANLFEQIITKDRDWSVAVQFTAMNMKCAPCREFAPHFDAVAKSWVKVEPEYRDQHFWAVLDFADAVETFRRLQLVSAPVLHFYPAAKGPRRPKNGNIDAKNYDFNNFGFDAETLSDELSRFTPKPIPYKAPVNWGLIGTAAAGVLTFGLLMRLVLPILASRWIWAAVVISSSIVFTTGIMFVRIRNSPWVGQGKQGSWLAGGYQNQYGMEVEVMTGIYGTLAFSYVALIFLVPRITSPFKQRVAVYIWCTVILLLFSVLLSLFSVKNPAYPFRLLL